MKSTTSYIGAITCFLILSYLHISPTPKHQHPPLVPTHTSVCSLRSGGVVGSKVYFAYAHVRFWYYTLSNVNITT